MRHLTSKIAITTLLFCTTTLSLFALTPFEQGCKAYGQQRYKEAASFFEQTVRKDPSADGYYNLGNAEYRLKRIPQAVLSYQRALHLDPSHNDARTNLEFLQRQIAVRNDAEMLIVGTNPWDALLNWGSVATWTKLSLICLAFFVVLWQLFRHSARPSVQKLTFTGTVIVGVCFCLTTVFAGIQRYRYQNNSLAVLLQDKVNTYVSPMIQAKRETQLPAGTSVEVLDDKEKEWSRIRLSDGMETWVQTKLYERVSKKD